MPAFPKAQVHYTKYRGHGKEIVLSELANASGWAPSRATPVVFVAVGGDGILHDVVNGVMESSYASNHHVYLFNIPLGKTNNFYKSVYGCPKITFSCDAFVQSINELQSIPINIVRGTAQNDQIPGAIDSDKKTFYFINVASIGITAEVVNDLTKNESMYSPWKYGLKLWTKIFFGGSSKRSIPVSIHAEGVQSATYNAFLVAVCNGEKVGSGMSIAPHCSPLDKKLAVVTVHDASIIYLIGRFFRRMMKGSLSSDLEHVARIDTDKPVTIEHVLPQQRVFVEADGEAVGILPATFQSERSLKFLTIHGAPGLSHK